MLILDLLRRNSRPPALPVLSAKNYFSDRCVFYPVTGQMMKEGPRSLVESS